MPPVEIRRISHQNYVAAGIIQRCWRGYRARKRIWSYGGARYVFCVVKVQCAWRIFMVSSSFNDDASHPPNVSSILEGKQTHASYLARESISLRSHDPEHVLPMALETSSAHFASDLRP